MEPEFSRRIAVDRIGATPRVERLSASEDERHALCRRLDLLALDRFEAEMRLTRADRGDSIALRGRIVAAAVQRCVVSLQPLVAAVDEPVAVRLLLGEPSDTDGIEAIDFDPDSEDEERVLGDAVDLGELAVQYLAVALPAYPRAPDVVGWTPADSAPDSTDGEVSPFAALGRLQRGGGS